MTLFFTSDAQKNKGGGLSEYSVAPNAAVFIMQEMSNCAMELPPISIPLHPTMHPQNLLQRVGSPSRADFGVGDTGRRGEWEVLVLE